MSFEKPVSILAMGKYLPQKVDSSTIERNYDIPDSWAEKNSGVRSRHQVTFESGAYMGARAIEDALEKADIGIGEVDLIISASATFDYPIPNQASVIKSELDKGFAFDCATMDVDSTCLSFISGFETAASLLDGVRYKNIVVVSAEISSKGLDSKNWETITLFGDGAVAAILRYDEQGGSSFIKGGMRTYSEGVAHTIIKGGGNKYPIKDFPYDPGLHSFGMDGFKILKLAKKKIPLFAEWFFSDLPMDIEDINAIFPHQGSKVGLTIFRRLFNFKENQVKENLSDYGNCIAASIPLLLHDEIEKGMVDRGDTCLLIGTSAGFSIGATLFRY